MAASHTIIPQRTATVASSIFNLANTILGAGLLAMPAALAAFGLIPGLVMVISAAICAGTGLYLYTLVATHVPQGNASFNSLSKLTYPYLSPLFDFAIAVKCFGVSASYLIVIGETMPPIMAAFWSGHQGTLQAATSSLPEVLSMRLFWITVAIVLVIPLAFQRRLDALKYTSFFALLCVLYVVALIFYFFFHQHELQPVTVAPSKRVQGPIAAVPILVFAYTCHQNVFSIYNELKTYSQSRINVVMLVSVAVAGALYTAVGLMGYLMFGDEVSSDVMEMLPNSQIVTAGRLGLAILFVFSYPLQIHPARASLDKLFLSARTYIASRLNRRQKPCRDDDDHLQHLTDPRTLLHSPSSDSYGSIADHGLGDRYARQSIEVLDEDGDEIARAAVHGMDRESRLDQRGETGNHLEADGVSGNTEMPNTRLSFLTSLLVLGGYAVALSVSSLDTILGFVGATGSATITFILPGLFYWKLHSRARDSRTRFLRIASVSLMFLGLFVFAVCVSWRVYKLAKA